MKTKFDELKNPEYAVDFLADHLINGTLVLFIGAGTSTGFGLPNWSDLINAMRRDVGLNEISDFKSPEHLQIAADEVQNKVKTTDALISLVQKHLYTPIDAKPTINVLENHLLISLSSLLMGSKRGHVTRVVTLNYDSMLEWFLSLFGFVVKTINKLPDLEGSEDVRIYHPHGFIPHPEHSMRQSDFIILGLKSANTRIGTPGDPWFEMIRHILDTGVCLFIGMSPNTLSDRALAPLFTTSGEKHKDIRPLGIWLVTNELEEAKESEFGMNNIIPVHVEIPSISEFILNISQSALKKINK